MRAKLALLALMFGSAGLAHTGVPALWQVPTGPYTVSVFDDLHVGTPTFLVLVSQAGQAPSEGTEVRVRLAAPGGTRLEPDATFQGVTTYPDGEHYAAFVISPEITEAGRYTAEVEITGPAGVARRTFVAATQSPWRGLWLELLPSLVVTLSIIIPLLLVWQRAAPQQRLPGAHAAAHAVN